MKEMAPNASLAKFTAMRRTQKMCRFWQMDASETRGLGRNIFLSSSKEAAQNIRGRFESLCQAFNSSSRALASFRSSVSKPSVNQP